MNIKRQADRILYATHQGVHVLRFIGDIRHPMSPVLESFLDQLLCEKSQGLVIDLSETRNIDSTCLGLLVRTALRLRGQGLAKATVVSTRPDITDVLRSMSFDRLFNIVDEISLKLGSGMPLKMPGSGEDDNLLEIMLGAHRTLMSLSEHNRLQFKDVVEALERESEMRRKGAVGHT